MTADGIAALGEALKTRKVSKPPNIDAILTLLRDRSWKGATYLIIFRPLR